MNELIVKETPLNLYKKFDDTDYVIAKLNHKFRDYANNMDLCIFKPYDDEDSAPVFVNDKLFDYINEYDYIKVKGPKDPIYVYYRMTIIAVLMPIKRSV